MKVFIRPEHLIGNSWSHVSPNSETCPLALALKPMLAKLGINDFHVGAFHVFVGDNYILDIPFDVWNFETVDTYIKKANEGCLHAYLIHLDETIHFQQIIQKYGKEIPSKLEQILSPEYT